MSQSLGQLVVTVATEVVGVVVVATVVVEVVVVALVVIAAAGVVAPLQLVHLWTADARVSVSKALHATATRQIPMPNTQNCKYSCTKNFD